MPNDVLMFLGGQGSGKKEISTRLAYQMPCYTIGIGDSLKEIAGNSVWFNFRYFHLFRGTVLRQIDRGHRCSDAAVKAALKAKMWTVPQHMRLILDGFPRTEKQMREVAPSLFEGGAHLRLVFLECPKDVCVQRIQGRVQKDIEQGLTPRTDDLDPEAVKNRLKLSFEVMDGIVDAACSMGIDVIRLDATQTPEEITLDLVSALSRRPRVSDARCATASSKVRVNA